MKCILHIGTEKTGTTLLQDWLYSNQEVLRKERIYLSEMLGKSNNRKLPACFSTQFDDFAKQHGYSTYEQKAVFFEGFLDAFADEIKNAKLNSDLFIITSEHFHSRTTLREEIQELKDFLSLHFSEIKVVCYFRNQFDTLVSLYSTALKGEDTLTLDEYLNVRATPELYYANYLQVADNWSEVFGRDACEFRIYDRARFLDGDLRKDFISLVADNSLIASMDFSVSSANESLSYLQAVAFRRINEMYPFWTDTPVKINKDNTRKKAEILALDSLKQGKLGSHRRAEVEQSFRSSNEEFFEKYFGSGNQFLSVDIDEKPADGSAVDCEKLIDEMLGYAIQGSDFKPLTAAVDGLRDMALRMHQGAAPSKQDALFLMQLALAGRPNGPLLKKKVAEWSKTLSVD
ncbi:hypothetical protein [Thioclava sp. GXIMD4216]|uniref:hypothetical protein n=1 Tax=Thioclava sp. GXIMD4216 TaxID=3131929 RepID=UPI0030D1A0B9